MERLIVSFSPSLERFPRWAGPFAQSVFSPSVTGVRAIKAMLGDGVIRC